MTSPPRRTDQDSVQYGPNGVQWCSDELLQAIAQASQRTGRRVHMHLLETKYQRQWADATYPDGVVRMLDDIGLLSIPIDAGPLRVGHIREELNCLPNVALPLPSISAPIFIFTPVSPR